MEDKNMFYCSEKTMASWAGVNLKGNRKSEVVNGMLDPYFRVGTVIRNPVTGVVRQIKNSKVPDGGATSSKEITYGYYQTSSLIKKEDAVGEDKFANEDDVLQALARG